MALAGITAVSVAVWLVDNGKNAVFATALLAGGLFLILVAAIPDRFEQLGVGILSGKLRRRRQVKRAAKIAELTSEKESPEGVTVSERELPTAGGLLATMRALDGLLRPRVGPLAGCELHVYTFDEGAQLLVPFYEPEPEKTPSSWAPGVGVTGQAYITDSFVLASEEHTHNDTHKLPPEERATHLDLLEVAAIPITNAADNTIAIMAISNRVRPGILSSSEGYEEVLATREAIARILIDLFGGFEDT